MRANEKRVTAERNPGAKRWRDSCFQRPATIVARCRRELGQGIVADRARSTRSMNFGITIHAPRTTER